MPQQSRFQRPYKRPQAEDVFTDREKSFALFRNARDEIEPDRPKLLVFFGIGGQGKSALCDALIRHLEKEEPRRAAFGLLRINDDNYERPHEALLDLRLSIGENSGISFHAFDIAFALFWKQAYPEQDLRNYRIGRISRLMDNNLPDFVKMMNDFMADHAPSSTLSFIFRASRWLDEKRQHKQAERTFPLLRELHERDKVMPPDQLAERLPLFLAVDLEAYLKKKPEQKAIVFIDEYEQLWKHLQLKAGEARHLVDEAIKELVIACPGILFVIFSREQLHWGSDHSGWIEDLKDAQHLLGGLSSTDADNFLAKCGVVEPSLRHVIIGSAGGDEAEGCHPELLDLAVDHYLSLKFGCQQIPQQEDFQIGSASLSDRRQRLVHRFLRGCNDRCFRDTLRYLAAAESFDRSLFEELVLRKTGFAPSGFDHLVSYSFVQRLEEGRYRLHPRMREVLTEDMKQSEHDAVNSFYFSYYDKLCRPTSPSAITPDHETSLSAAARHLLELDEARFSGWLDEVSKVFDAGARFQLLRPLRERELATLEKALGHLDPKVGLKLNNIALLHTKQGRYEVALSLYERALSILKKTLGPNHPDVAACLNNIAGLHRRQGRYAAALPLHKQALSIVRKALGPGHLFVANCLNNIALVHHLERRYEEALPLYEQAREIWEKESGLNHTSVALVLNNIAGVFQALGQHKSALPLYERARAIWEKELGQDHPDLAKNLINIAMLLHDQRKYESALPPYTRALSILEKAFGPDHYDIALLLDNMARLHNDQGRYETALPFYERALAIKEKQLGRDHPDVAKSRQNVYICQQNLRESKVPN